MPRTSAALLALAGSLLLASLALPAAGQGHEHGVLNAAIAIAHDAPPDGRTYVGNVNHFAILAHGDDAIPDFHQDVPWRVSLDGVVLAETTPESGHDYDGVNVLDIVFPAPGTYKVEALDAAGNAVAAFAGIVEPTRGVGSGTAIEWDRETVVTSGTRERFEVWPYTADATDQPIPHSDCTVEVLRGGRVEFRTKTHTHEEKQSLEYVFPEPGTYDLRVLCYQAYSSPRAVLFSPSVEQVTLDVLPAVGVDTGIAAAPAPAPPAAQNAVVTAPAGGMTLVGTFDPYTVVGPDTLQHLNVLAVDDTGQTLQHVDFTATLTGPLGRIFSSDTLHEYDGIYELTTRQSVPGIYTLRVTAEGGPGSGELAMSYAVLPRATPLTAGLVTVDLDAPAVTGEPGDWLLSATSTSGPFAHGELEVRLTAESETVPYLQAKLHTHDDGLYPFRVALPTQEPYRLEVTPFPLTPDLVLPSPATFEVEPAAGTPLAEDRPAAAAPAQEMPASAAALALAGLAVAAVALRRRGA